MKLFGNVKNGTWKRWFNFDSDPDDSLNPVIYKALSLLQDRTIFSICVPQLLDCLAKKYRTLPQ